MIAVTNKALERISELKIEEGHDVEKNIRVSVKGGAAPRGPGRSRATLARRWRPRARAPVRAGRRGTGDGSCE